MSIDATSSLTVSDDQRSGTKYFGGVAAPEAEAGSMLIVFGETTRVTGTLRVGANLIELIGRTRCPDPES